MNIFQAQAVEKILKNNTDSDFKLVFKLNNEIFTASFKNEFNNAIVIDSFGDEKSVSSELSLLFKMTNTVDISLENPIHLKNIIDFVNGSYESVSKSTNAYAPVLLNVTSLTNGYKLPFMLVSEIDKFEILSIIPSSNPE